MNALIYLNIFALHYRIFWTVFNFTFQPPTKENVSQVHKKLQLRRIFVLESFCMLHNKQVNSSGGLTVIAKNWIILPTKVISCLLPKNGMSLKILCSCPASLEIDSSINHQHWFGLSFFISFSPETCVPLQYYAFRFFLSATRFLILRTNKYTNEYSSETFRFNFLFCLLSRPEWCWIVAFFSVVYTMY